MNPSKISIKIDADPSGAIAGLEKVARGINKVGEALITGFGIDIAGRITNFLSSIPRQLEAAVKQGVAFNATLEDSRLGIAAVLKQFQPEKFADFNDALKEADSALDSLKQKALESPASFKSLVASFQAVTGAASGAGIDLQKQVDLIVIMSQALAGLGIREEQIIQESRALITGNINQDAAAAKILNITTADINAAKQAGQLYEFLTGKLRAFAEAGKVGATNFTTAFSNMGDAFEQTAAKLAKPIFDALKQNFLQMTQLLADPGFTTSLEGIAGKITTAVNATFKLIQLATTHADFLSSVFQQAAFVVGALALLFVGFQAKALLASTGIMLAATRLQLWTKIAVATEFSVAGLGTSITSLIVVLRSLTGVLLLIGAAFAGWDIGLFIGKLKWGGVEINTLMQMVYLDIFGVWEKIKAYFTGAMDYIHNTIAIGFAKILVLVGEGALKTEKLFNKLPGVEFDTTALEKKIADSRELLAELTKDRQDELDKSVQEAAIKLADQIRNLEQTKERLISEAQTPKKKAGTESNGSPRIVLNTEEGLKLIEQINQDYAETLLSQRELLDANYQHTLLTLRQSVKDEEDFNIAKLQLDASYEKRKTDLQQKEEEARQDRKIQSELNRVALERARLESDFTKTDVEKRPELLRLLKEEADIYDRQVKALTQKLALDTSLTEDQRQAIQQRLDQLTQSRDQAGAAYQGERGKADPNSFRDQFISALTDLQNEWGTWAIQAAQTFKDVFQSAVSSISDGIMGLIDGTMTWGQALNNIGTTILRSLVQGIINMGVQWFLTHIFMQGVSTAFHAFLDLLGMKSTAKVISQEASKTPVLATNAALSSVSSYGGALLAIGALAALVAAFASGFSEGGFTGAGGTNEPAGVVHKGEFVVPAKFASIFPNLEALRTGAISVSEFATGFRLRQPITSNPEVASILPGLRGSGSGQAPPVTVQGHSVKYAFVGITEADLKRHIEEELPDKVIKIVRGMKGELGAS